MGVKRALFWLLPKGTVSLAEHEQLLHAGLLKLQARAVKDKSGASKRWESTCQCLRQTLVPAAAADRGKAARSMKDMWVLTVPEVEGRYYLIPRQVTPRRVMEVSPDMLPLMERKLEFRPKFTLKLEGQLFRLGDFEIFVGSASNTSGATATLQGHLIILEYMPLSHIETASPIIQEMVDLISAAIAAAKATGGRLETVKPKFEEFLLPPHFSPRHAAVMQLELCTCMLTMNNKPAAR